MADQNTTHPAHIGWIGTGVMGGAMALRLLGAGYRLTVHNRTRARATPLMDAGASWADTAAAAAATADFVITMVGTPEEVRAVYFGSQAILAGARRGAVLIDMGTSPPSLAREIAAAAAGLGLATLDAPVSGGDIGAREGRLSIMVGGDRSAYERALPILEVLGTTIVYQGGSGCGQHAKLCSQIVVAGNMIGACEALLYAQAAGLDPLTVLRSIGAGAASSWSLSHLYPRMAAGDYAPGFYVRHFVKDMELVLWEAERLGIRLPGLELVSQLYQRVMALGGGDLGTQALYLALQDLGADRAGSAGVESDL